MKHAGFSVAAILEGSRRAQFILNTGHKGGNIALMECSHLWSYVEDNYLVVNIGKDATKNFTDFGAILCLVLQYRRFVRELHYEQKQPWEHKCVFGLCAWMTLRMVCNNASLNWRVACSSSGKNIRYVIFQNTQSFARIFTKEVLVSGEAAMWQMSARFFLLNRWLKMHSTPKWSCLSVRNYRSHQLENIRNSPATSCRDARGR